MVIGLYLMWGEVDYCVKLIIEYVDVLLVDEVIDVFK